MFGGGLNVPVPDVDRTDHLLMLGANPFASNGSLATAPDWPGRIERLVERGGTLVVVDPRRSRTAEAATEWVPIRPGADAYLLMAMVQVITSEGPRRPRRRAPTSSPGSTRSWPRPRRSRPRSSPTPPASPPTTSAAWPATWPPPPPACVYGRIGTTTAEFGTLTSWLVDVLNVLTGNLDRPGGAMFTTAAAGRQQHPRQAAVRPGRQAPPAHRAASASCPETFGELPAVAMAEEMDTPGEGQIRALVTVAGNPVLSTPNSARLDAAIAGLDFSGGRRHLRQRDHPARRRDPAGPVAAAEGPLRPGPAAAGAPRHVQLQRARPPARCGPARRVGGAGPAGARAPGRGDDRRSGPGRRPDDHLHGAGERRRRDQPHPRPRRRRDPRGARPAARPGADPRLPAAHRSLRGGLRCRPGRVVARQAARQPARHRPRRPEAAPPRRAPHARRDDRPGARRSCSPTSHGCTRASTAGGTTRSCSSGGGTSGRTTRGCTTCRCW